MALGPLGWDPNFIARDPGLWPLARAADALPASTHWPSHADLDRVFELRALGQAQQSLRFAPIVPRNKGRGRTSAPVRAEALYDGLITIDGVVPTRGDNWHDLLNALCFSTFPRSKLALHARQYRAQRLRLGMGATKLPPVRTREQDALTVFDEGGVIVAALPEAAALLAQSGDPQFEPLLREQRAAGNAKVVPFGHALFEHMVEGAPCPGGSAQLVPLDALSADIEVLLADLDAVLALQLSDAAYFSEPRRARHLRMQGLAAADT